MQFGEFDASKSRQFLPCSKRLILAITIARGRHQLESPYWSYKLLPWPAVSMEHFHHLRLNIALALIAAASVLYQLLVTRLLSVTLWYHFAFAAISMAMLGLTAGGTIVSLYPRRFGSPEDRSLANPFGHSVTLACIGAALSTVVAVAWHLGVPIVHQQITLDGFANILITFILLALPLLFSGIAVCAFLAHTEQFTGRLYASDLVGAGLGCLAFCWLLSVVDGPSAALFISALFLIAATFVARRGLGLIVGVFAVVVILAGIGNTNRSHYGDAWLRIRAVKEGMKEGTVLHEKWNAFSRVAVSPDNPLVASGKPFGWGMSRALKWSDVIEQYWLTIDGSAGTPLTRFDGNLEPLEYLKHDVTNVAHYLRPQSDVLVIGPGGGRDILSALIFNQRSVTGIELNETIVDAVTNVFGSFTGHLASYPRVKLVTDEARSWLTRTAIHPGIIQVSLIDTAAASAAGAYVLTEHSVYTVEAWKLFLSRLQPGGILSVSRWHMSKTPFEVYRLVSLARGALEALGAEGAKDNVILVSNRSSTDDDDSTRIATILVSNRPFSAQDVETIRSVSASDEFELLYAPHTAITGTIEEILTTPDSEAMHERMAVDISPPTDNRPFFFFLLRFRDILNPHYLNSSALSANEKAVTMLFATLFCSALLLYMLVILPTRRQLIGNYPTVLFLYFSAIGTAYMLIEIALIQRLTLFLGHPTYSLMAVLFGLLIATGLGSLLSGRILPLSMLRSIGLCGFVLVTLAIIGVALPALIDLWGGSSTPVRIVVALGISMSAGLVMGTLFPLGMEMARVSYPSARAFLWAVNGAFSVFGSVGAILVSLRWGISTTFWLGVVIYFIAGASMMRLVASNHFKLS